METKICKKKAKCSHFVIENLIRELGGLGNENKLKGIVGRRSEDRLQEIEKKIKSLGQLVEKFEKEVVGYFNARKCYPCVDPMQICWGRQKYRACLACLEMGVKK